MATATRIGLQEFLALPGLDERRLELIDGEVYEKPMPTWGHGTIAGELYYHLRPWGFPSAEPRAIILETDAFAASSPLPDLAFYPADPPPAASWMERPPQVAAEMLSPGQSRSELRLKVEMYLRFGVTTVWVIDPERRSADLYEGGRRSTIDEQGELRSTVIPDFRLRLGDVLDSLETRREAQR